MKYLLLVAALLWPITSSAGDGLREEIPFILDDTRDSWVSIFVEPGLDVLDFSYLVSWRCGIEGIEFVINDDDFMETLPLLRCSDNEEYPWENENDIIAVEYPIDMIDTVTVWVYFPDGTFMVNRWNRGEVEN